MLSGNMYLIQRTIDDSCFVLIRVAEANRWWFRLCPRCYDMLSSKKKWWSITLKSTDSASFCSVYEASIWAARSLELVEASIPSYIFASKHQNSTNLVTLIHKWLYFKKKVKNKISLKNILNWKGRSSTMFLRYVRMSTPLLFVFC